MTPPNLPDTDRDLPGHRLWLRGVNDELNRAIEAIQAGNHVDLPALRKLVNREPLP